MSSLLLALLEPVITHVRSMAITEPSLRAQLRELGTLLLELGAEPLSLAQGINSIETSGAISVNGAHANGVYTNGEKQAYSTTREDTVATTTSLTTAQPLNPALNPPINQPLPSPITAPAVPPQSPTPTPFVSSPARPATTTSSTVWRSAQVSDTELPLIAQRCRLKAEAVRWVITRQTLLHDNDEFSQEIVQQDRNLITRARQLPDCYLWMLRRESAPVAETSQLEDLAGCFDAAAAVVDLLDLLVNNEENENEGMVPALELAAEAQSALRCALTDTGVHLDTDQTRIFNWLRVTCRDQQVLLERYMRSDDPADPTAWGEVQQQVQQQIEQLQNSKSRTRQHRALLNKMRYHLKLIQSNTGQDRSYDWKKVAETVEEAVNNGLQPSNRELRDLLLPVIDELPSVLEFPKNMQLALREIDRYLATVSETSATAKVQAGAESASSEQVQRVAEMLHGRSVVLIGGDRRPAAVEAITHAFGLQELVWIEGYDHSYTGFEPQVARPDVALVILAIRWSRHGFGEVKAFCEEYNKPLVRLPGGYNANQLAYHILAQVSERLLLQTA